MVTTVTPTSQSGDGGDGVVRLGQRVGTRRICSPLTAEGPGGTLGLITVVRQLVHLEQLRQRQGEQ